MSYHRSLPLFDSFFAASIAAIAAAFKSVTAPLLGALGCGAGRSLTGLTFGASPNNGWRGSW